jgi:GAF domain-containing protein
MSAGASQRFLGVLTGGADNESPTLTTLCRRTLALVPASSVSVVLMDRGHNQSLAGASDATAESIQNLEFTLGEGPGVDAYAEGRPVLIDDLHAIDGRWPQFSGAATELGVCAVLALPLQVGAIRLGVLALYRDQPWLVSTEQLTDVLLVADLVTHLVLAAQSEVASESVAWALDVSDYRVVVHQATGMISAQLEIGIEEALVRLRGRAFGAERPIDEVAEDVLAGFLSFEEA